MTGKTTQGARAFCANSLVSGAEARGFEPRIPSRVNRISRPLPPVWSGLAACGRVWFPQLEGHSSCGPVGSPVVLCGADGAICVPSGTCATRVRTGA